MRLHLLFALTAVALPLLACSSTADVDDEEVAAETGEAITGSVEVGATLHATSRVNLRSAPATSSEVLKTIAPGKTMTAVEARPTSGFYRVKFEGTEGWVFGTYLTREGGMTPGAPPDTGNYTSSKNVKLVYQGSCDFLHRCDSYSRRLPAGQVNWGCLGRGAACVDTDHWMSGPNRSYCGKTVKVCKGSTCTTAKIMDVSVSQDFEASQGVMSALGIGFGGGSTCSNTYVDGDPRVTVHW
ncbi:MAG: SH3 domain-containing protein [Deltaproteobacteria bacterium]|nr:SH3 domain-containing protein [Deltaproteobacteria bacterium]